MPHFIGPSRISKFCDRGHEREIKHTVQHSEELAIFQNDRRLSADSGRDAPRASSVSADKRSRSPTNITARERFRASAISPIQVVFCEKIIKKCLQVASEIFEKSCRKIDNKKPLHEILYCNYTLHLQHTFIEARYKLLSEIYATSFCGAFTRWCMV